MVNPLIFIHAILGELGLIAYLWVLVELLNPTETRVGRAKVAAVIGLVCLLIAWIAGGYYYVNVYGADIKPAIKASDAQWVHGVIMETKEHLFLFLPILAMLTTRLVYGFGQELIGNKGARNTVTVLSGLIFLLGFAIAGMGVMIAAGYRYALEAGIA